MSPPPPPISRWGHAWRVLLAAAVGALAWFELARWQWENARWWFWLDLALGVLALVLAAWRRRHPVATMLATAVLASFAASAGGGATLALFSLATRRRWRELVLAGVVGVVSGTVFVLVSPTDDDALPSFVVLVAAIGVTIGWGMFVGSRRELLATLRDRAATVEAEQAGRLARARTAERARIAREMHDVLAHRISLVTMHAGALEYRDDLTPEQVRTTAGVIRESSHQALVELREVLGVLREDPGDAAPEKPQPEACDVPALLAEARAGGMRVDERLDADLAAVPRGVGRTTYRIVQEGLTNARKHAPETLVGVTVTGAPGDRLVVEVRNPLPLGAPPAVPDSGLGLVGLRERTELAGGTLRHGIEKGRAFVLRASLPWPA